MKRSLFSQTIKQSLLAAPAAALMLGAAHAGTTIGLNFQSWYYDSGANPQTVGYGQGYQTTGFPVTAEAFGVPTANWFNTDPLPCDNSYGSVVDSSTIFGSTGNMTGGSNTFAGTLTLTAATVNLWESDIGNLVDPANEWGQGGPLPVSWSSVLPGNDEVTWSFEDNTGWTNTLSGLNATFPNGYVLEIIGATKCTTGSRVLITDGATFTNSLGFDTIYSAGNANFNGPVGLLVTPALTSDSVTFGAVSRDVDSGQSCALAGFILTDKPVISRDPQESVVPTGGTISLSAVVAALPDALAYQWRSNGVPIAGATSATFAKAGATVADSAGYDVVVTNLYGSATSEVASVTVLMPATLTWDANTGTAGAQDGDGTWDTNTANWWNGSGDTTWSTLANANFGAGSTNAFTVTISTSVVPNTLTFNDANYTIAATSGQTLTLAGDATITANADATISAPLAGSANVTKTGDGTLTLVNNGNTFSGNLQINAGTVLTGTSSGQGTLGAVTGGRSVTISNGATLRLRVNNVFGGGGRTASSIPAILVAGATLDSTRYNSVGNVTLQDGATLSQSASDSGSYQGYQFLGSITAKGASASTISTGNGKADHLLGGGTNVFDVADVTGDANPDLIVSAALINGSGDYSGIGSLIKTGAGTLSLSNTNTYTGPTMVSEGTLAVSGQLSGGGDITLADNTGFNVTPGVNPTIPFVNYLTFGNSITATNMLGFANLNSTTLSPISVGSVIANSTVKVNITGTILFPGNYPLMNYGTESGAGSFVLGSLPAGVSATLVDDHAYSISLNVTATPVQTEVWSGSPNGNWDINNTANWLVGASTSPWTEGNIATFDDTATGTTAITLNTNVNPSDVHFNNTGKNYSISGSGSIAGGTSVNLNGAGTVTLANTNTYGGGTFLSGGSTLIIDKDASLGSSGLTFDYGTLVVNGSTALTLARNITLNGGGGSIQVDNTDAAGVSIANLITGAGSLTKSGDGALNLSGMETYNGGTTVNGGTLYLGYGGSSGTLQGSLTINSNATVVATVNNALGYSGANWVQNIVLNYGTLNTASTGDNGWGLTINMTGGKMGTLVPNGYFAMGDGSAINVTGVEIPSVISANMTVRDNISFYVTRGTAPIDLVVSGSLLAASGGGITVGGDGIMQLSGPNNTYTGPTEVQYGTTLIMAGRLTGAGDVTVDDAAELDMQTAGGLPAIANAANLTLGSSGTLTLGFANVNNPSVPVVTVTNLTLNDAVTVNISGNVAVGQFPLIKYAGTISGTGSFALGTLPADVSATLSNNVAGQSLDLVVTSAPLSIITDISSGTNYGYAGGNYTLTVVAGGNPPLNYQWYHDNTLIPGATSGTLALTQLSTDNEGSYYAIASSGINSLSSSTNHLIVLPDSGYASMALATGPTAYWPLNESSGPSAADYAGGHTATYAGNGVTYNVPGPVGTNVVSVNGSSGQVSCPYSADLNPSGPFTAEAWLNPASVTSSLLCALSSSHAASPRAGWLIYSSTAGWEFRTYNQNDLNTAVDITGGTPTAGNWDHVAVVWDGSVGRIYVNGVLENTSPVTNFVANSDSPVTIGSRSDSAFYWNGSGGDVAIYNRALTQQEIQTHAQNAPILSITSFGGSQVLSWVPGGGGTLLASPIVNGTYTNVPAATSPWTNAPTENQKFYRVKF